MSRGDPVDVLRAKLVGIGKSKPFCGHCERLSGADDSGRLAGVPAQVPLDALPELVIAIQHFARRPGIAPGILWRGEAFRRVCLPQGRDRGAMQRLQDLSKELDPGRT